MYKMMIRRILPLLCILAFLSGCSNDDGDIRTMADLSVVIKSGETYKFVVTTGNDEDALLIKHPSNNFEISEYKKDSMTTNGIYTYKPIPDFIGVDEVEIEKHYFTFDNDQIQRAKALIKIKITVEKDFPEKIKD